MTIHLTRRTVALALVAFLALTAMATTSLVLTLTSRADASHKFNDIATGTFFHEPTAWLADNGIADGYPDGTFRPNGNITRGQAAYWFSNYDENLGSIPGPQGPEGPQGPAGPQGPSGTSDYNNAIEIVETNLDPPPGTSFAHTTNCPSGDRAVAGGGSTVNSNLFITDSVPTSTSTTVTTGWRVRWETDDDTTMDPTKITVFVQCIPVNVP